MSATTYKTWDDVPEEVQLQSLMRAIEACETEEEMRRFSAKELGIPIETIPPGEMVTK